DGIITMPEEQCDQGIANGTAGSCCTASCGLRAAGATCRPSAGVCDVAETCDGDIATCPADGFATAGTSCTSDDNVCTDDQCDGSGACGHSNNSAPCDDGLFCTQTDTCSGGSCAGAGDPCSGGA